MRDLDLFLTIYSENYDTLIRYAKAYVYNDANAEDVLQNVMIRFLRSPEKVAHAKNRMGFLLRSIRNEAIDLLRKEKRDAAVNSGLMEQMAPEPLLEDVESRETLSQLLRNYEEPVLEAFIAYVLYDAPVRELARELGVKPNSLTKQFGRMKAALEKQRLFLLGTVLALTMRCLVLFCRT